MPTEVKLPRLGQGMDSGVVVKWLKNEGDRIEKGEPLYELDTEKVTQEVEAPESGVLLKILLPEGEAAVGTAIAYIGEQGEHVPDGASPASPPTPEPAAEHFAAAAPTPETEPQPASTEPGGRRKASPLARRLARERGLELVAVEGSGPEGRIVADDVRRAAGRAPAGQPSVAAAPATSVAPAAAVAPPAPLGAFENVPLTTIRRTIARRLTEAWQAPLFQLASTADMSEVLAMRRRLAEREPAGGRRVSIADFLTKAAAQALVSHPGVNALWRGDSIEVHHSVHIGIATATDRGLIVPVLRDCERKTLAELAAGRADLVSRTLDGSIDLDELEGGTFTISNLGTFDVEQFVALLNPPQVAILAVSSIVERPVVRAGEITVAPTLSLTLTCDHRAVDGSVAAGFLTTVKASLEEPGLML